jgi:hypothetical protein
LFLGARNFLILVVSMDFSQAQQAQYKNYAPDNPFNFLKKFLQKVD